MINKYWVELILVSLWITAILNIQANVSFGHDALTYVLSGQCFLREAFSCTALREPVYPMLLALLMAFGGNMASVVPVVQNVLFLLAVMFYVSSCFCNGRLGKVIVVRTALLITLIPTFLVVINGAIYTESISASFTLIQLSLVVRFVRYFVLGNKASGHAGIKAWAEPLIISVLSGGSSLIKGSFVYVQFVFGLCLLLAILVWKFRGVGHVRIIPSIWITTCIIASPLIFLHGWSVTRPLELADELFGRGGTILLGRTEYAKEFSFRTDSLPFLINALSETTCRKIFGTQCASYNWYSEFHNFGEDRQAFSGLTQSEMFSVGKLNLVQRPFLQMGFAFFEWSRFILHHTTTGFARLNLPLIGPLLTSFGFVLLLKIANITVYAGLFWLIPWRSLHAKPELVIPLLFFVAYLLPYGFVSTVVRMIYPVAPLLVLILADLGLQKWHHIA